MTNHNLPDSKILVGWDKNITVDLSCRRIFVRRIDLNYKRHERFSKNELQNASKSIKWMLMNL